jgi:hypothetical protein
MSSGNKTENKGTGPKDKGVLVDELEAMNMNVDLETIDDQIIDKYTFIT